MFCFISTESTAVKLRPVAVKARCESSHYGGLWHLLTFEVSNSMFYPTHRRCDVILDYTYTLKLDVRHFQAAKAEKTMAICISATTEEQIWFMEEYS